MPTHTIKLLPNNHYHIYTRGINSCNIFNESKDYENFLLLYEKYIFPVANTFAWVLMPNHIHLQVKIKDNIIYKYTNKEVEQFLSEDKTFDFKKWETITLTEKLAASGNKLPKPTNHFAHLLSSYSGYFNTIYSRHGHYSSILLKERELTAQFILKG